MPTGRNNTFVLCKRANFVKPSTCTSAYTFRGIHFYKLLTSNEAKC
jgi:hypothetical protein